MHVHNISLKRNSLGTVFTNFTLNRDNKRNVRGSVARECSTCAFNSGLDREHSFHSSNCESDKYVWSLVSTPGKCRLIRFSVDPTSEIDAHVSDFTSSEQSRASSIIVAKKLTLKSSK